MRTRLLVRADQYIYLPGSDYTSVPEGSQPEPTARPGPDGVNDAGDAEGEGPKLLSKKEKERLKKEKEKVSCIISA
jgi:hypothetical protein